MDTEYTFTLPRGYVDDQGQVHREGRMRLATAIDEIGIMQDPRALENEAYLPVLLFCRVITRLGGFRTITPGLIEKLFASDFAYLEDFYNRINESSPILVGAVCPHCANPFNVQVAPLGD